MHKLHQTKFLATCNRWASQKQSFTQKV